jgi:hypothetical protein
MYRIHSLATKANEKGNGTRTGREPSAMARHIIIIIVYRTVLSTS